MVKKRYLPNFYANPLNKISVPFDSNCFTDLFSQIQLKNWQNEDNWQIQQSFEFLGNMIDRMGNSLVCLVECWWSTLSVISSVPDPEASQRHDQIFK